MLTPSTSDFPAPIALFTTTRGATPAQRGWLSAFKLDKDGLIVPLPSGEPADESQARLHTKDEAVRFETPTSSGKANALDIRAKSHSIDTSVENAPSGSETGFWILLTDDDRKADLKGAVRVLEWGGWGSGIQSDDAKPWEVKVVAEWPDKLGTGGRGRMMGEVVETESQEQGFTGASHAIWLD